jgi:hypothetical protein
MRGAADALTALAAAALVVFLRICAATAAAEIPLHWWHDRRHGESALWQNRRVCRGDRLPLSRLQGERDGAVGLRHCIEGYLRWEGANKYGLGKVESGLVLRHHRSC